VPEAQILRENKELGGVVGLAQDLGISPDQYRIMSSSNVTCAMPLDIPGEVGSLLVNVYQRYLLSSRNFDNFLDGQIYHASKPDKPGQAHPRFDNYNPLTAIPDPPSI